VGLEIYDGVSPIWVENSGALYKSPEEAAIDGARARDRHPQRDALNRAKSK
jgi:hypothetical protein